MAYGGETSAHQVTWAASGEVVFRLRRYRLHSHSVASSVCSFNDSATVVGQSTRTGGPTHQDLAG